MSYDLAVWPASRAGRPAEVYELAMDELDALADAGAPPSAEILGFLGEVVSGWPDDDGEMDDFPWSVAPVAPDSGAGDVAYLTMTFHGRLDEMCDDVARIARRRGLVVYDPQRGAVVS